MLSQRKLGSRNTDWIPNQVWDDIRRDYMPKVKTHKGTAKRFRKTKTGKLMHRASGQDHFNSRDAGKVTKNKRRDVVIAKHNAKIAVRIPHN